MTIPEVEAEMYLRNDPHSQVALADSASVHLPLSVLSIDGSVVAIPSEIRAVLPTVAPRAGLE
jgi:hypothetical protein